MIFLDFSMFSNIDLEKKRYHTRYYHFDHLRRSIFLYSLLKNVSYKG